MNKDSYLIFEKYQTILKEDQNLGTLVGATNGGEGGNWGGSLPKLISLLPMGNWNASSQKRDKMETASGHISDHFSGNQNAYAADFGLNSTFNSNPETATKFAIDVARKVDPSVTSWEPFKNKVFERSTQDGYRVQVIWQSNVGGNHYDHVHVGVKKGGIAVTGSEGEAQDTGTQSGETAQQTQQEDGMLGGLKQQAMGALTDFSAEKARSALASTVGAIQGAIKTAKSS